jgi:hypothetical protein
MRSPGPICDRHHRKRTFPREPIQGLSVQARDLGRFFACEQTQ